MATHGFGFVGCGMIAEFHTKAINEIAGARVVAAFDKFPASADKIAKLAGGDCKVYEDIDSMLANPDVDVVCVCTPSGAHMEPAVLAAKAGKHVVVEKPMEITLPRCGRDPQGVRRGRGPALHDLPVAVLGGQPGAQGGHRRRPVRAVDPGRHLCQVVADAAVITTRAAGAGPGSSTAAAP